jgi:hypothetical protein
VTRQTLQLVDDAAHHQHAVAHRERPVTAGPPSLANHTKNAPPMTIAPRTAPDRNLAMRRIVTIVSRLCGRAFFAPSKTDKGKWHSHWKQERGAAEVRGYGTVANGPPTYRRRHG